MVFTCPIVFSGDVLAHGRGEAVGPGTLLTPAAPAAEGQGDGVTGDFGAFAAGVAADCATVATGQTSATTRPNVATIAPPSTEDTGFTRQEGFAVTMQEQAPALLRAH
jgi:hypothetical protein